MNDAEPLSDDPRSEPGDVGLVEPRDFISTEPFTFECGQTLPGFTLRYETYGRPNAARDNAILICHALSGDHHCAGIHSLADRKPGWWNNLIGPGNRSTPTSSSFFAPMCSAGVRGRAGLRRPTWRPGVRTAQPFRR